MSFNASQDPVWLVSPVTVDGATRLELHAVQGTVALCGRTAEAGGFFTPRSTHRFAPCQRCSVARKGVVTTIELVRDYPVTYRQLDHWIRMGLVNPVGDRCPGNGNRRLLTAEEANVVIIMSTLTAAGFSPHLAHTAARNAGWLAPGIRVVIEQAQTSYSPVREETA